MKIAKITVPKHVAVPNFIESGEIDRLLKIVARGKHRFEFFTREKALIAQRLSGRQNLFYFVHNLLDVIGLFKE